MIMPCGFVTGSGPDEVELAAPDEVAPCSCEESLALRRELAQAHKMIDAMERGGLDLAQRLEEMRAAYQSWRKLALQASAQRPPAAVDARKHTVTVAGEAYGGLD